MIEKRVSEILDFIKKNPECSSKDIYDGILTSISYATVKRELIKLVSENLLLIQGKGKGTKYIISPSYELLLPVNIEKYYRKEVDERKIKENFDFTLIQKTLKNSTLFTETELIKLSSLQRVYKNNVSKLTDSEIKKELERLAIDLSWKSSQIEGNTYSLLETERLLREKETASGKTKEEAIMLLNHKAALDFIIDNQNYLNPLKTSKIEYIHSLLIRVCM